MIDVPMVHILHGRIRVDRGDVKMIVSVIQRLDEGAHLRRLEQVRKRPESGVS